MSRKIERAADELVARLKISPELRTDEEYLRLWLELASELDEPSYIFDRLESLKIGENHTLRWVAQAFVAEKAARYAEADEILSRGAACDAQPRALLAKRRREFDRRMKRHWLTIASGKSSKQQPTQKSSLGRRPLRVLQPGLSNITRSDIEPPKTAQNKPKINRKLNFSTAKRDAPPTTNLHRADLEDMTINSIIAAREIDDIFIDNLSIDDQIDNHDLDDSSVACRIFNDGNEDHSIQLSNPTCTANDGGFTIFCDD
uniref:BUB1 N-terminal domain-containing protein n=1 Tax=Aureoumbra lagunensis TaxID=44058 RepID=A0A7S3JXA3_9STRA